MSDLNKRRLGYAILIIAVIVAGVLGVQYPIPAPPDGLLGGVIEVGADTRGPANFARFTGPVQFKNAVTADSTFALAGAQTNAGALTVAGATALNGGLTMDTNKFTVADATGATLIAGALSANGGIAVDTNAFTVADTSGNTVVAGTFAANGGITVDTNAFVVADTTGATTIAGALAANGGISVDTNAFTVADTSGNTVVAGTFAANGGITVDTSAFTVADTSGNVATAGTLGVAGTTTLSGKVVGAPSGVIALADDFTLVPTRTVQLVSAEGAIGGVIGTSGAVAGQLLYLVNVGAQNIVITDTGTMKLAGNATLTADDAVQLIFDGTNWVQVSAVSAN